MMRRLSDRIANNPALIGAVIVAAANLVGVDNPGDLEVLESFVIMLAGWAVRSQVIPTRKIETIEAVEVEPAPPAVKGRR